MYSCPRWFSGECEDVGKILDLIKNVSLAKQRITTKSPVNKNTSELIAENIKLGEVLFRKVKIVNLVEAAEEYTFDPLNYEEYRHSYLEPSGKQDDQRGIVYRSIGARDAAPIMVKILLYENDEVFADQLMALKNYLFGSSSPKEVKDNTLVDKDVLLSKTATATDVATKWTTSTACNACVRAALFLIKNDSSLFPIGGSAFHDPENNFVQKQIKGYIKPEGRAKDIKEDFDELLTKPNLNDRFVEIQKGDQETWSNFFERLQGEADTGRIIVGVMLTSSGTQGHIVMITPGGLHEIESVTETYGASFTTHDINKVPRILECGGEVRENEAPLCRNIDRKGSQERLKWYRFLK